jgi:hypothetical protein
MNGDMSTKQEAALHRWANDILRRDGMIQADLDLYAAHVQSGRPLGPAARTRREALLEQLGELAVEFHWCRHALSLVGAA